MKNGRSNQLAPEWPIIHTIIEKFEQNKYTNEMRLLYVQLSGKNKCIFGSLYLSCVELDMSVPLYFVFWLHIFSLSNRIFFMYKMIENNCHRLSHDTISTAHDNLYIAVL